MRSPINYSLLGPGSTLEAKEDIFMFSGGIFLLKGETCIVTLSGPAACLITNSSGQLHAISGDTGSRNFKVTTTLQQLQKLSPVSKARQVKSNKQRRK